MPTNKITINHFNKKSHLIDRYIESVASSNYFCDSCLKYAIRNCSKELQRRIKNRAKDIIASLSDINQ